MSDHHAGPAADPLRALRAPIRPVAPDPAFAARLRTQLERALDLPRGVTMATSLSAPRPAPSRTAPTPAAIPYLAVADARWALDWYVEVYEARVVGEPIVMPDGRIGHAELAMSGGALYLADAHPEIGVVVPAPEGASVTLVLEVTDLDATLASARGAGGRVAREPYEGYGFRNATVVDPFGHRWMLQQPLGAPAAPSSALPHARPAYRHGDVGYLTLLVPDVERARRFYAAVLGWRPATPDDPRGGEVLDRSPAVAIWGGDGPARLTLAHVVDDIDAAVAEIRAAGGRADDPVTREFGRIADCADPAGTGFAVYEPAGERGPRPDPNGDQPGDVGYLTLHVGDSGVAREFLGRVLGWIFRPGRVADGWQVEDSVPMAGLAGGQERPQVVPMWRVADIASAVARVREAGGWAGEPSRQPYGWTADCVDDQGLSFTLGEL